MKTKCFECGDDMETGIREVVVKVSDMRYVDLLPAMVCVCGEYTVCGEDLGRAEREAARRFLVDNPNPRVFQFARKALNFSKECWASWLGTTAGVVEAWETGQAEIPSAAVEAVLGLIDCMAGEDR